MKNPCLVEIPSVYSVVTNTLMWLHEPGKPHFHSPFCLDIYLPYPIIISVAEG